MKKSLSLLALALATTSFAQTSPNIPLEDQLGSITVEEIFPITQKSNNQITTGSAGGGGSDEFPPNYPSRQFPSPSYPSQPSQPSKRDPLDTAGKVISVAKDMVGLGEEIYSLVQKGKPSNTTDYAAISVVPRDPYSKDAVDPFDLEGFSMPEERNFKARVKNGAGKEVVSFEYKVVYSYGGSFNGRGKYLTGVMIVPSSIKTSWGWDFSATMKLQNIMNHGTKDEPVAGAMLVIQYKINSWSAAFERNDTIHVTGQGQLKNYSK